MSISLTPKIYQPLTFLQAFYMEKKAKNPTGANSLQYQKPSCTQPQKKYLLNPFLQNTTQQQFHQLTILHSNFLPRYRADTNSHVE